MLPGLEQNTKARQKAALGIGERHQDFECLTWEPESQASTRESTRSEYKGEEGPPRTLGRRSQNKGNEKA